MTTKDPTAAGSERRAARRLAMLVTDVAGVGAATAKLGDLTIIGALQEFFRRSSVLQTTYQGRVLKTFGDGFLAVFEEAADALDFATALGKSLVHEPLLAGERLVMNSGLHVASVVVAETSYGEDVFGAEVNVAANLERQARLGEIVVSEAACQALAAEQQARLGPSEQVSLKSGEVAFRRMSLIGAASCS